MTSSPRRSSGSAHRPALVALGAIVLVAGTARAAVTFETPEEHAVGFGPEDVETYDFNGDAWPDVVTANQGSGGVSLLINLGGNLTMFTEVPAGGAARQVASGDLDGDGNDDLVVGYSQESSHVGVIRNLAHGAFLPPVTYGTAGSVDGLFVHDVDGDGFPDVIATDGSTRSVRVYGNLGDGTLGDAAVYTVLDESSYPSDACLADVDGDGHMDVLMAAPLANTAALYLRGLADGTFAGPYFLPTTLAGPTSVAAGDLDGDDDTDVVVVDFSYGAEIRVFFNLGGGAWSAGTGYDPEFAISLGGRVRVADVDGDGSLDLLAIPRSSGFTPGRVAIFLNDGSGAFTPGVTLDSGGYGAALLVADLDGNVAPDVAVADQVDDSIWVLRNTSATGVSVPGAADTGFRLAGPNPTARGCEFAFAANPGSIARIRILDPAGRVTRTLTAGGVGAATRLRWDGRDESGRAAPSGVYFARLERSGVPASVRKVVLVR